MQNKLRAFRAMMKAALRPFPGTWIIYFMFGIAGVTNGWLTIGLASTVARKLAMDGWPADATGWFALTFGVLACLFLAGICAFSLSMVGITLHDHLCDVRKKWREPSVEK